jgi:hypothetical protein
VQALFVQLPEVTIAIREAKYQGQVSLCLDGLQQSIDSMNQAGLEKFLSDAQKLELKVEHFSVLANAQKLSLALATAKQKISSALLSLNVSDLTGAVEAAESIQYSHADVDRCRQARTVMSGLAKAIEQRSFTSLQSSMRSVKSLQLSESNSFVQKASDLLVRIKEAKNACANASSSCLQSQNGGSGSTELQHSALESAVKVADSLGGLNDVEEVVSARKLLSGVVDEGKVVTRLVSALESGGWLNSGAQHGEYDRYQSSESIDVKSLEGVLNECGSMEMKTAVGRILESVGTHMLGVRQKVKNALKSSLSADSTLWEDASESASVTLSTGEHDRWADLIPLTWRVCVLELNAAIEECDFQRQVAAVISEVVVAMRQKDHLALDRVLKKLDGFLSDSSRYTEVCSFCSLYVSRSLCPLL